MLCLPCYDLLTAHTILAKFEGSKDIEHDSVPALPASLALRFRLR